MAQSPRVSWLPGGSGQPVRGADRGWGSRRWRDGLGPSDSRSSAKRLGVVLQPSRGFDNQGGGRADRARRL